MTRKQIKIIRSYEGRKVRIRKEKKNAMKKEYEKENTEEIKVENM